MSSKNISQRRKDNLVRGPVLNLNDPFIRELLSNLSSNLKNISDNSEKTDLLVAGLIKSEIDFSGADRTANLRQILLRKIAQECKNRRQTRRIVELVVFKHVSSLIEGAASGLSSLTSHTVTSQLGEKSDTKLLGGTSRSRSRSKSRAKDKDDRIITDNSTKSLSKDKDYRNISSYNTKSLLPKESSEERVVGHYSRQKEMQKSKEQFVKKIETAKVNNDIVNDSIVLEEDPDGDDDEVIVLEENVPAGGSKKTAETIAQQSDNLNKQESEIIREESGESYNSTYIHFFIFFLIYSCFMKSCLTCYILLCCNCVRFSLGGPTIEQVNKNVTETPSIVDLEKISLIEKIEMFYTKRVSDKFYDLLRAFQCEYRQRNGKLGECYELAVELREKYRSQLYETFNKTMNKVKMEALLIMFDMKVNLKLNIPSWIKQQQEGDEEESQPKLDDIAVPERGEVVFTVHSPTGEVWYFKPPVEHYKMVHYINEMVLKTTTEEKVVVNIL